MATKRATGTKKIRGVVYTLGQGGPSLYDLRVNASEVILLVNGPGMLFDHLEVLTSLSAATGATANAWQAFVKGVACIANCGSVSKLKVVPELKTSRVGVRVWIPLGPVGMYQTEMTLRVRRTGETFRGFLDRIFGQTKRGASYAFALCPAIATGHAEHHHQGTAIGADPAAPGGDPHAGHNHHH